MLLSRLKLITFDVTDTLLKFKYSVGKQYGEIGAMYGISCDNNTLNNNFVVHWRRMKQEHPNFGLYSGMGWENWWKNVVKHTFKDCGTNIEDKQLKNVCEHLINVYKTSSCWQQCYGASNLLSYIRSKGIPMGIISNFDPRLHQILFNMKISHFFQFILTSYETGAEKPDVKMFEKAMTISKLRHLEPEECLHVGNKRSLDYEGARASGWHGVLIDNNTSGGLKTNNMNENYLFASLYHLQSFLIDSSNESIFKQTL